MQMLFGQHISTPMTPLLMRHKDGTIPGLLMKKSPIGVTRKQIIVILFKLTMKVRDTYPSISIAISKLAHR